MLYNTEATKDRYLNAKKEYESATVEWERCKRDFIRKLFEGFSYNENNQFMFDKKFQHTIYQLLKPVNLENKKLYQILKDCSIIFHYDDNGNIIITKPKDVDWENMMYG